MTGGLIGDGSMSSFDTLRRAQDDIQDDNESVRKNNFVE